MRRMLWPEYRDRWRVFSGARRRTWKEYLPKLPFITHRNSPSGETPIYPESEFHPISPLIGTLSPQCLLVSIQLGSWLPFIDRVP